MTMLLYRHGLGHVAAGGGGPIGGTDLSYIYAKKRYAGASYNPVSTNPELLDTTDYGTGAIVADANIITPQVAGEYFGIQYQVGYDRNFFNAQLHAADSGGTLLQIARANTRGTVDDFTRRGNGCFSAELPALSTLRLQNYNNRAAAYSAGSSMSLVRPGKIVAHMRSTATGAIGANVQVAVDQTEWGDPANVDLVANTMTVPTTGWYLCHLQMSYDSGQNYSKLRAYVESTASGNIIYAGICMPQDTSGNAWIQNVCVRYLTAGDTLKIYTDNSATKNLYYTASAPDGNSLTLWLLHNDDVLGVWGGSTGTMTYDTPGSTIPVTDFDDNLKGDPAVMTQSGEFTIPSNGWYMLVHDSIWYQTSAGSSGAMTTHMTGAYTTVEMEGVSGDSSYFTVMNGVDATYYNAGGIKRLQVYNEFRTLTKRALPQTCALIKLTEA